MPYYPIDKLHLHLVFTPYVIRNNLCGFKNCFSFYHKGRQILLCIISNLIINDTLFIINDACFNGIFGNSTVGRAVESKLYFVRYQPFMLFLNSSVTKM